MTAVLEVPSFMVPETHNFLLNPEQPDFSLIQVEPAAIFHFDQRLFS